PAAIVLVTLSLHDALPIPAVRGAAERLEGRLLTLRAVGEGFANDLVRRAVVPGARERQDVVHVDRVREQLPHADRLAGVGAAPRSEEHTSELQSRENLVCR